MHLLPSDDVLLNNSPGQRLFRALPDDRNNGCIGGMGFNGKQSNNILFAVVRFGGFWGWRRIPLNSVVGVGL